MPQKAYLWILRIGAGLSFISVFIVAGEFLFPYITGKQIYFNILIEILVVFWLAFIIKYPQWNPFKLKEGKGVLNRVGGGVTAGLIAFFAVMLASCFTGVDFNLSFWGDIERMLGFFHVVHFLFLYFIIITVFRDWEDWKWLLMAFVAASMIVGLTGLYGDNAYGTVGNKAYMAGFMIFGVFFALLLLYKEKQIWRWAYLIPVVVMLFAFKNAGIAGAFAGLGAGVMAFLFFYGIFVKNKKVRWISLGLFILILGGSVFAITNKDAPIVRNIDPIQDFSLEEDTFQTRLIAWEAAWKDFSEHPFLGTGHGNFAVTFNEYFTADFYDYTRSGTFFDRAHNNLIGIASTTGALGALAYLSIFVAFVVYVIKAKLRDRITTTEVSLILALCAAYFVQNLAVFDSLPTYIGLMLMLGLGYYLATTGKENSNKSELFAENKDKKLVNKEIYALIGVGVVMLFVMFQYNIKSMQMLWGTIQGQKAFARGNVEKAVDTYQWSLDRGSPLNRDSRSSFIKAVINYSSGLQRVSQEDREEVLKYAVELGRKNLEYNPEDTLLNMRLAQTLNFASQYLAQTDQEASQKYGQEALKYIDKAIETSPERIPLYNTKAQILLTQRKVEKAIETLETATDLNKNYESTRCRLAEIYLLTKKEDKGYELLDECLNLGGASSLGYSSVIKQAINRYIEDGDIKTVEKLYQRLSKVEGDNAQVWIKMAKLYYQMGKTDEAKKAAEKAAEIDPSLKGDLQSFIQELENDPQPSGQETTTIDISPGR